MVRDKKTDQINALHAEGNGAKGRPESPLVRLGRIIEENYKPGRRPAPAFVTALIRAGRHGGWTEQDVMTAIAALWPEAK